MLFDHYVAMSSKISMLFVKYDLYKVRHVHKLNWSLHVLAPGLLVQQLTCLDMQCLL